jgi:hypothetical protein
VKDISATGGVDDRDFKARLVPTVGAAHIAKPHTIRAVGNDDGGSPIIPECIHDRVRFRFSCQAACESHRQHQMLHLVQRVGLNLRLDVGDDGYLADVGTERCDGGSQGVRVEQHSSGPP